MAETGAVARIVSSRATTSDRVMLSAVRPFQAAPGALEIAFVVLPTGLVRLGVLGEVAVGQRLERQGSGGARRIACGFSPSAISPISALGALPGLGEGEGLERAEGEALGLAALRPVAQATTRRAGRR